MQMSSSSRKRSAITSSKSDRDDSSDAGIATVKRTKRNSSSAKEAVDLEIPLTESVGEVLHSIRQLSRSMKGSAATRVDSLSADLSMSGITEAKDLDPEEVSHRLEELVVDIASQIIRTNTFELTIPNRSSSNQRYLEDVDRIVLGDKTSKRLFLNTAHVRKAAITTRVIELVHEVLSKSIHITKRDLFYTDVKLFKDQGESDAVLDDVACMAGCTRTSLHVIASDKGLVVGRIQYLEAGDLIDCTKMGIGGMRVRRSYFLESAQG